MIPTQDRALTMKRIFLFLATNLAVLLLLSFVIQIFGIDDWLARHGSNATTLLIFAAIFGFGGAFVSLLMSKAMAKFAMGVRVIDRPATESERWLVDTVRAHAGKVGIGMPEVGVFDSPQPNAFATGARRDAALVAVSTGLLASMRREEVDAVLGHEISHVANGDMVTLALLQGVLNTFVIFLARVVGSLVDGATRGNDSNRGPGMGYFFTVMAAELVFGLFASIIVAWFSRYREFRADAGGANLSGTRSMIGALQALKRVHSPSDLPQQFANFGINGKLAQGFQQLFMSHPPLDERIAALEKRSGALSQVR